MPAFFEFVLVEVFADMTVSLALNAVVLASLDTGSRPVSACFELSPCLSLCLLANMASSWLSTDDGMLV